MNFRLKVDRQVLCISFGQAADKAVTCAEIVKKKFHNIHQITHLEYKK